MSAVATGELPSGHSHEYHDQGRSKFTCTLCGEVNVEGLFVAWEQAEHSSSELYDLVRDLQQRLDEVAPSEATQRLNRAIHENNIRMAREFDERNSNVDDDDETDGSDQD